MLITFVYLSSDTIERPLEAQVSDAGHVDHLDQRRSEQDQKKN